MLPSAPTHPAAPASPHYYHPPSANPLPPLPDLAHLPQLPPLPAQAASALTRQVDMSARPRRAASIRRAASYAEADDDADDLSSAPQASSTRPARRAAANRKSYAVHDDDEDDYRDAEGDEEHHHRLHPAPAPQFDPDHQPAWDHAQQPDQAYQHQHQSGQQYVDPGALKVRLKFGSHADEHLPAAAADEADGDGDQDAAGDEDPDAEGEPDHAQDGDAPPQGEEGPEGEHDDVEETSGHSLRPRRRPVIQDTEDEDEGEDAYHAQQRLVTTTTSSGRTTRRPQFYGESGDDEDVKPQGTRRGLRRGGGYHGEGVEQDDEYTAAADEDDDEYGGSGQPRPRSSRRVAANQRALRQQRDRGGLTRPHRTKSRQTRNSRKADQSYEHDDDTEFDTEEDDEMLDLEDDADSLGRDNESSGRRTLRNKPRVNYFVPLSLDAPANGGGKKDKGKGKQRRTDEDGNPFAGLPANMTGAQWAALYPEGGQPSDSSDDDTPNFGSPRKGAVFTGAGAAGMTGGMLSGGGLDFGGAGAPGNLGKVQNAAALADTDPLGVSTSISFDSVGGLGSHIQQLKEMVSLPLLYPEVFERFNMTPPRGVLFHGPPGTGKTLLARALAASCSTDGRKICASSLLLYAVTSVRP